jgi:hypothetical protein
MSPIEYLKFFNRQRSLRKKTKIGFSRAKRALSIAISTVSDSHEIMKRTSKYYNDPKLFIFKNFKGDLSTKSVVAEAEY